LNAVRCGKVLIEFAAVFIKVREIFVKAKQKLNAAELPGSHAGLFHVFVRMQYISDVYDAAKNKSPTSSKPGSSGFNHL
jgi:hypothetical protein